MRNPILRFNLLILCVSWLAVSVRGEPSTSKPEVPCPTCPLAIGLEQFRQAAGGAVIPVLIELEEPSGLMHQMSGEQAGRSMTFKELTEHGGALVARHHAFLASLPRRGVRALLRE